MSLRLRSASMLVLALSASAAITVACGKDEGGEEHSGTEPAICMEISSVCHDADQGSGVAHDCHEQAHAGDVAVCEMIHDECIAACSGTGTGTETGTTTTSTTMTSTTESTDEGSTTAHDESTTEHHDESTTTTDHGTDETGAPDSCDLLGSGCHDNETPEGQECHDIGHAGEVAACDAAFEMCAKICGF